MQRNLDFTFFRKVNEKRCLLGKCNLHAMHVFMNTFKRSFFDKTSIIPGIRVHKHSLSIYTRIEKMQFHRMFINFDEVVLP